MKKYHVQNYIKWKHDMANAISKLPDLPYEKLSRDQLIIRFLPLVEKLARRFSTSQQASGVMSIMDFIQEGNLGLCAGVDRITWDTILEAENKEKTLKSFLSKRIKGAIRRGIDSNRGSMRIPEHKLNEIRSNNGKDRLMVEMFFNSIFLSIDDNNPNTNEPFAESVEDPTIDYNLDILNVYLLGLMQKHLNEKQYDVLRYSYGINCDKLPAKEIAGKIGLSGTSAYVRVSELKKEAVQKLIDNVDHSQVVDYL